MVVFKILSKVSGQQYIGACRSDIYERWELYVRAAEAGLDFPLYQEIREQGEAQFSITELDYSDSISEVKEMELMYCMEFCARSLQGYKFGQKDTVVKRCKKSDLDSAWRQELEQDKELNPPPARSATPSVLIAEPAQAKRTVKPRVKLSSVDKAAVEKTAAPQRPANAGKVNVGKTVERPQTQPTVAVRPSNPASEPPRGEEHAVEKSILAEGVGLMVQALNSAEQLSARQQRARKQTEELAGLLTQSEQAIERLCTEQQLASEKARQALAAVTASQAANDALREAQTAAHRHLAATIEQLSEGDESLVAVDQLQQGLMRLLGRLKSETAEPVVSQQVSADSTDVATEKQNHEDLEAQVVKQHEAKMVNRLKELDRLISEPQTIRSTEVAERDENAEVALPTPREPIAPTPDLQARAWVAPAEKSGDSATLLEKVAVSTKVVHRRAKTVVVGQNAKTRPAAVAQIKPAKSRPLLTRKRLGLK